MNSLKPSRVAEIIRSMPGLFEIFFGRLAKWIRLLARWHKEGRLRRELLARRTRFHRETLEPRLMLSADVYAAVTGNLVVHVLDAGGTTPTLEVLDNGASALTHVRTAGDPYSLTFKGTTGYDTLQVDFGFDRAATAAEQAAISISFSGRGGSDKLDVGSPAATLYVPQSLTISSDQAMIVSGNLTVANDVHLEVDTASDGGMLGSNINAVSHARLLAMNANNSAGGSTDLVAHSTLNIDNSGFGGDGLQLAIIKGSSNADLTLDGSTTLSAGGNLTLSAVSDVVVNNIAKASALSSSGGGAPGTSLDAAVAMSIIDSSATAHVLGNSSLSAAGDFGIIAANTVNVTTVADETANGNAGFGATLALSVVHTNADASLDGAVIVTAQNVNLHATSVNDLSTTAKSTAGGAQQGGGAVPNQSEQRLADYGAATSDGSVNFAGAIAISDLGADTHAFIESGAVISASGNVDVLANFIDHASAIADASNTTGSKSPVGVPNDGGAAGVGVAVAIDIGKTCACWPFFILPYIVTGRITSTYGGSTSASLRIGSLRLLLENSPGFKMTSTTIPDSGLRMVRIASTSAERCISSSASFWFSRAWRNCSMDKR